MGFRDWFKRSEPEAPLAAPTLQKAVEPIDIGEWADQYAPRVQTFGSAPSSERPLSNTHFHIPDGYDLIRADGSDSARFEMPSTSTGVTDPKGLYWDPFALVQQLGFRDRPTAITFATLNAMVWRMPIVQAVIQTRINQVSSFCTPQKHKFETGFRVKMRDQWATPTNKDKKFCRAMEETLLQCGSLHTDPRGRDTFETFMRKIVRDSMTYDAMTFEIVPDHRGIPAEWYAVDASTIRLANSSHLYPDDDINRIHTVQIYDNVVIQEFTRAELAYEVRNPRTDIRGYGYGTPELEMLVGTITSLLYAFQYNQNAFTQGSLQKGLLNLVGSIPEKQLKAFRRQWYQQLSGVENAWRTPITNAERIDWINMQNSSKDMEFSAWMDFLIKVICSCFAMDPVEVNFKYGNSGGQKAMFEGGNKSKLVESKDRGLKPLLRFLSRAIDKYIIWPTNPDYTFEFVGLEAQAPKEMADLFTQRVRTMYTIDELRAESDMPPLPDGLGDVILDANWMNARKEVLAKKAAEEQEKQNEAQLEAQAAALAAMPESQVSKEEMAQLAQLLANPGAAGGAGAPPITPVNGGGPGGGKVAPAAPPEGAPGTKPAGAAPNIKKSFVLDFEV